MVSLFIHTRFLAEDVLDSQHVSCPNVSVPIMAHIRVYPSGGPREPDYGIIGYYWFGHVLE